MLSNGRYSVMVTAAGSGYSRWGDVAVTRWREDVTCDDWGSYVFLRDAADGAVCASAPAASVAKAKVVVARSSVRKRSDFMGRKTK